MACAFTTHFTPWQNACQHAHGGEAETRFVRVHAKDEAINVSRKRRESRFCSRPRQITYPLLARRARDMCEHRGGTQASGARFGTQLPMLALLALLATQLPIKRPPLVMHCIKALHLTPIFSY